MKYRAKAAKSASAGRPRRGTAAPADGSAVEAKRPKYIVIFREPSERNTTTLSKVLRSKETKEMAVRSSLTVLEARTEAEARPRVYERLGVAVADLSGAEVSELRTQDTVAAIVTNQLRRIPPFSEGPDVPAVPPSPHPFEALRPLSAVALSGDPVTAYLLGLRDAADLALRAYQQRRPLPEPAPLVPGSPGALETGGHSWCLTMIGLGPNYTTATGRGVRIAVLDTGIDLEHPDFAGRFAGGNNTASFVPGVTSAQDGHGHGTHCAGVVAAAAVSSGGRRYSVAPDADLMIGKVLDDRGSGYDDQILDGIDWAADGGARVISMSLGSPREVGGAFADPYEVVAHRLLQQTPGVLIVAAAGNESNRPFFTKPVGNPAACPSILAVAACDSQRRVAPFSCCKMDAIGEVDVTAPGVAVYSAWTGKGFRTISGTSMATPHAAGTAALYLEAQPALTAAQLGDTLRTRATLLGSQDDFGHGLIQVP